MNTVLVAAGHAPLRASSGLRMVPDLSFAQADGAYAMVLVAGEACFADSRTR